MFFPTARSARTRVAVAATVLFVAPMFAACSGSDDTTGTTSVVEGTTASTSTTTSAPAAAVDQSAPGSANGLKVADDGTLWIASIANDELLNVDPEDGTIVQRIAVPDGAGPDDVVIDDQGTVFWTGFLSGDVGAAVPSSGEVEVLANIGQGANPITLRDDGMLVVGRAMVASQLWTVDPTGGSPAVHLVDPAGTNSFDITPDGRFFAPNLDENAVVELDPATGQLVRTVAQLDGPPIALRWHDDAIYVLALVDGAKVIRVDPESGTTELFADTGLPVGDNLAVAPDGTVYVTGLNEPTVTVISPDGQVDRTVRIGS